MAGAHDRLQFGHGFLENVVHHDVIIPWGLLDLAPRRCKPPIPLFGRFGPSAFETDAESVHRRRQYEYRASPGIGASHLTRSLHVDLEQDVPALLKPFLDPITVRAVKFSVNFSPFQETSRRNPPQKFLSWQEMVILPRDLAAPRGARRAGNGIAHFRPGFPNRFQERCLADPRWRGNHEELALKKGFHQAIPSWASGRPAHP